ncbi:TetR/AcrR family transcriptional regulator [Streptomyces sp. PT12]|uniref:TetR/AcrR family transcriptional regulator n=1 Tax=Streptomyces sp. PT12 TaxID=1510197 RepID=UPI000DE2FD48|nr:TetR/AcrR family transcriptional regulator [Streptomyces sp. PT12]RBM23858.1 TetR family transcriptional regulator [Streptomyces sp. PT12]
MSATSVPHTPAVSGPRTDLRERKKLRTRQAIWDAAYRLFAERGYDATRVDQIAEAAEVSVSTVFRYFPTKEDIVLSEGSGRVEPVMEAAMLARPAEEAPLTALRAAIHETLARLSEQPEAFAKVEQRMRLIATVPALRSRMQENLATTTEYLTRALSERTGYPIDSLELRVFVGAVIGGFRETLMYWASQERPEDLRLIIDRAIDVLETDLASQLGPA